METDVDVAALHGYLSGDGYVIKNAPDSKYRYHFVGFRNTEPELLLDFQEHFERVFCDSPHISKDWDHCVKGNKEYYEFFTTKFGSFYSREWRMPEMSNKCCAAWLRAFFDCEGWVVNIPGKDRAIGLESVNPDGLRQVQFRLLESFNIASLIHAQKHDYIFRLSIYGKENLRRFRDRIGFLHPKKQRKLDEALESYDAWRWIFPLKMNARRAFVRNLIVGKAGFQKDRARIYSREENLNKLSNALKELGVDSHISRRVNGHGTVHYELAVYGKNLKKLRRL